jgi:hypothetical protein
LFKASGRRLKDGRLILRSIGQLEEASKLTPTDPKILEALACGYVARALEIVWMTTPEGLTLARARENREIARSKKPTATFTAPLMGKAVAALEKALKLPGATSEISHTLGWVWLVDVRQGLTEKRADSMKRAGEAFQALVKAAPNNARYHQSYGDFLRSASNYGGPAAADLKLPSADEEYAAALRLDPNNEGLNFVLYTYALRESPPDLDRARDYLLAAQKADPSNGLYSYLLAGIALDQAEGDAPRRLELEQEALQRIAEGNSASVTNLVVYSASAPAYLATLLRTMVMGQPTDMELPLLNRLSAIGRKATQVAKRWETDQPPQALAAYTTLVAMGERLADAALSGFSGIMRLTQVAGALELEKTCLTPLAAWAATHGTPQQILMVRQKQQELDGLNKWLEDAILNALPEEFGLDELTGDTAK